MFGSRMFTDVLNQGRKERLEPDTVQDRTRKFRLVIKQTRTFNNSRKD